MPEIVCIFVWLIYNFYPFALSMRFLKLPIKKLKKEKLRAGPCNKAREIYHKAEIKAKETHKIHCNWA